MPFTRDLVIVFSLVSSSVGRLLGEKTEKGNSNLYQADNGFSCQLCKKGEYLQKACEINQGPSTCKFCPRNTFMDKENNFKYCADCRPCQWGHETVTECSRASNTVCQCPVGKYWVQALGHDGQCYNHSVCKDGEVVVAEGTPWTDTICGYNTKSITSTITEPSTEEPDQNHTQNITTLPTRCLGEIPVQDNDTERVMYGVIWVPLLIAVVCYFGFLIYFAFVKK